VSEASGVDVGVDSGVGWAEQAARARAIDSMAARVRDRLVMAAGR